MMGCNCKGKCKCICSKIGWVLVIIGGLNWGLVGFGDLMHSDWNVVDMLLNKWPTLLAVIYLLVGIATIMTILGCPCKKCKEGCKDCMVKAPDSMPGQNPKM